MLSETSTSPGFWYVTYVGERSRRVLSREMIDLDLEGGLDAPLKKPWVPPPYKIVGSGRWPDWMAFIVPLLSERALDVLGDMLRPHCQFLPWINEPEHRYTLINVTTRIPRANWTCEKFSAHGDRYASADVISIHNTPIPDLFRLEGYDGKTFVSDAVAHRSVEHQLKGALFVDPSVPALHTPFIPLRLGSKSTGFVRKADDLHSETAPSPPTRH
jgi:hypothetical protein